MILTFLGTRGEIEVRTRRHLRHSSLLVRDGRTRVMVDCGADWLGRLGAIAPTAIVLTHAHPDHAAGLTEGAPCPVYATAATLDLIGRYPIERRRISTGEATEIGGITFKAIPVQHSIRAPAVGYRVSIKTRSFFYVPDVARLSRAGSALRGVAIYVGDGASLLRPLLRKRNGVLIGHASIAEQLDWCVQAHVRHAIFTHCGSPIVRGNTRHVSSCVRRLGLERGVEASIASDGDVLRFAVNDNR